MKGDREHDLFSSEKSAKEGDSPILRPGNWVIELGQRVKKAARVFSPPSDHQDSGRMPALLRESPEGGERRIQPRSREFHSRDLQVEIDSPLKPRKVAATLIDVSDGGLGVQMHVPLAVKSIVFISGELHSARFCVGLEGYVRVTNCNYLGNDVFRVGLAYEKATCRRLSCAHEVGFSPESSGRKDMPGPAPSDPAATGEEGADTGFWGDFAVFPGSK